MTWKMLPTTAADLKAGDDILWDDDTWSKVRSAEDTGYGIEIGLEGQAPINLLNAFPLVIGRDF